MFLVNNNASLQAVWKWHKKRKTTYLLLFSTSATSNCSVSSIREGSDVHTDRLDMIFSSRKVTVHWAPSVSRPQAANNAGLIWKVQLLFWSEIYRQHSEAILEVTRDKCFTSIEIGSHIVNNICVLTDGLRGMHWKRAHVNGSMVLQIHILKFHNTSEQMFFNVNQNNLI